jgi:hypothetical protein
VKAVAGKWTGTVTMTRPTVRSGYASEGKHGATLTIKEDGTWENIIPTLRPGSFFGTVAVDGGVLRWRSVTTGALGTYVLHEGDGRRVLVLASDGDVATGVFTPAK